MIGAGQTSLLRLQVFTGALKLETASSSKTQVTVYQTKRRRIPEKSDVYKLIGENL